VEQAGDTLLFGAERYIDKMKVDVLPLFDVRFVQVADDNAARVVL
jgi:hypothetical protein